jgi:PEP-CTERM motif
MESELLCQIYTGVFTRVGLFPPGGADLKFALTLISMALLASVAGAVPIVTFDSYTPLDVCIPSASTGGLDFTSTSANICAGDYMYVFDGTSPNGNGTPALIYGFRNAVAVTQTGGGAFTLSSVDMTISWYDVNPSEDITVVANWAGGGSTSYTLTLIQGLQTYALNYANVSSVDFYALPSGSGYWLMDNVNYGTATPEPGTLALLGSGVLTGLGVLRRRLKF